MLVLGLVGALGLAASPALATSITLHNVATGFPQPIGIDYYEPTNKVLLSVNYSGGLPNNFDLVAADGSQSPFSSLNGLGDEVYVATVRSSPCHAGFAVGESFSGNGQPGQIVRLSADGSTVQNPWVTLPGETGLIRGGLFQDRYCAFNGDLVATTTAGDVWRITGAGVATLLASGVPCGICEGPTTVPVDPARYGPWSGAVLVTAEPGDSVIAVAKTGQVAVFPGLGLGNASESIRIIDPNSNFYGVDFADGTLVGAEASQFTGIAGDLLLADETPGRLIHIRWNGSSFDAEQVAQVGQFEGTTFAPAGIANIPPAADASISGSGAPVSATEGASFSGEVASFTDPDTSAGPGDYTATIDWGDGSAPSTATLSGTGGVFSVAGSHTYADEGSYTVTATISDADNSANATTTTSAAKVDDAHLTASGITATVVSGKSFNGAVATLADADTTTSSAADFTATIDWGDGSPVSSGTVSGSGPDVVSGGHAYVATGYFTIKTHIADDGGNTADARTQVLIFAAPKGGAFVIGDRNRVVGTAVTFWGAGWSKLNSLSGGVAPEAFKGFEDSSATPGCGRPWTSDPGNSTPPPPAPLPDYMPVIVSSTITSSGPTIAGDTPHMVVVKTNPDYQPNPGHAGTGTVVAAVC